MCRTCLIEARPDRARFVADSGAYTLNYAGCTGCAMIKRPLLQCKRVVEDNTETEEEDGEYEEITTFERQTDHNTMTASHVVAEHYHSFRIVRTVIDEQGAAAGDVAEADAAAIPPAVRVTHDYLMECVLCGKGADEQRLDEGAAAEANAAAAREPAASASSPPPPSFSLSSIGDMLRGSCAPGSSMPQPHDATTKKEDDEWAE